MFYTGCLRNFLLLLSLQVRSNSQEEWCNCHGVAPFLQRLRNVDGSPCPIIGLCDAGGLLKEAARDATVESFAEGVEMRANNAVQ
jgi:hypothetical protein